MLELYYSKTCPYCQKVFDFFSANGIEFTPKDVSEKEISQVFEKEKTWIKKTYGEEMGLVHTPTTMANYSAPSMMKHQGCRNFKEVFGKPAPKNAEYLMGFPLGASSPEPQKKENFKKWGA